ncbi:MAG: hypothetical protein KF764_21570 [Labilithrix sp.]|nr:hypothetical protein [Labilithrix sp.]MBX3221934.1 hypothetical protein [Labilithrix sp.]
MKLSLTPVLGFSTAPRAPAVAPSAVREARPKGRQRAIPSPVRPLMSADAPTSLPTLL